MTASTKPRALQFKVVLADCQPMVWRRILVPANATMWGLHVAIQDAMGWWDYHLHQFLLGDTRNGRTIGIPSGNDFIEIEPGWQVPVAEVFSSPGIRVAYEYDFGDGWLHMVELEKILTTGPAIRKPRCLAGESACPPEDCGGPPGYADLLEALGDPSHPEHQTMREWAPKDFDPTSFRPSEVFFDDPEERLRRMLD